MTQWEYINVNWIGESIELSPKEKFELGWFRYKFPKARITETESSYQIDNVGKQQQFAVIMLVEHLGREGWEALHISGPISGNTWAWFKRALPS
jgi:hypothetical protein